MSGKYVVFGELKQGWEVLEKLNEIGSEDGQPTQKVWIGDCGKC